MTFERFLQKKHGQAHTNDVASVLGVAPPSATEMLQKLAREKLVKYVPYHGATLTDMGERVAGELLEKHRTLAEFLILIGVPKEDAEIDACNIEHHVSRDTINQIDKFLEFVRDVAGDLRPSGTGNREEFTKVSIVWIFVICDENLHFFEL